VTVLHVTHSRREAESLGDVIFRLEGGQIHTEGGRRNAGLGAVEDLR
jgi:hypothetical protein